MTDLLELAKRCEVATGPDRGLDIAIIRATDANGYRIEEDGTILVSGDMGDGPGWFNIGYEVPAYTTSLDAALTLVPEGYWWHVGHGRLTEGEPLGGASIVEPGNEEDSLSEAEAATSILALCAAALYARAALAPPSS